LIFPHLLLRRYFALCPGLGEVQTCKTCKTCKPANPKLGNYAKEIEARVQNRLKRAVKGK
jgi:hypothetical protein